MIKNSLRVFTTIHSESQKGYNTFFRTKYSLERLIFTYGSNQLRSADEQS